MSRLISLFFIVFLIAPIYSFGTNRQASENGVNELSPMDTLIQLKNHYKKKKTLEKENEINRIIAKKYFIEGDYINSNKYYEPLIQYYRTSEDTINLIRVLRGIAGNNIKLSKEEDVVTKYLNEAKLLAIESNQVREATAIDITLAVYYSERSNFIEAFKLFNKSKEVVVEHNYSKLEYTIAFNLGNLYANIEEYDKAITHYKDGFQIALELQNEAVQIFFQEALASVYQNKADYQKALEYYRVALEYNLKANNINHTIYCYLVMSECYNKLNDFENADYYLEEAEKIISKTQAGYLLAYFNQLSGNKASKNKNYRIALELYHIAYDQYLQIGNKESQKELSKSISLCYEQLGEFKQSLEFMKIHKNLESELSTDLIAMKIKLYESNIVIETLSNEKRIEELENKNYVLILWGGGIIVISVLLIVIIGFIKYYKSNKINIEQKKNELTKANDDKKKIYDDYLKKEKDNSELSNELNLKSSKLQDLFFKLKEKNVLLDDVILKLEGGKNSHLINKLGKARFTDEELKIINEELTLLNKSFHKNLLKDYPKLTRKDLKLATLLKIDLTSKEIADILYISSASVDVSRSRLRKKMNLDRAESLKELLNRY